MTRLAAATLFAIACAPPESETEPTPTEYAEQCVETYDCLVAKCSAELAVLLDSDGEDYPAATNSLHACEEASGCLPYTFDELHGPDSPFCNIGGASGTDWHFEDLAEAERAVCPFQRGEHGFMLSDPLEVCDVAHFTASGS